MLWDVDAYSLFGFIIILLLSVTVLVMAWVIITRMNGERKDSLLDLECKWYQSTIEAILEGKFWGDPAQLRKKPGTEAWQAIEKLLFQEMEVSSGEQQGRLIEMFERLGYVEFYIRELQAEKSWRRAHAALRLGQMKNPRVVSALIEVLQDPNQNVRQRAVQALGMIHDQKALKALVEQIHKATSPAPKISKQILKASLIAHGDQAIPMLLPLLSDAHDASRVLVAEILAEIPSQSTLASLVKSLNDPHPEVRARAARALGKIKHPLGVNPLIESLSDPFWYVRLQSAKSLGKIGSPCAVFGLCHSLGDPCWQVRMAAAHSLMALGPFATGALTVYLLYTKDRYTGQQIAEILQQSGLVNRWIEDLAAADAETVQKAKDLLSAIARNLLMDPLVAAVRNHPDRQVRVRLVEILSGITTRPVSKVLRQISIYDSDPGVRALAQDVLSRRLRQRLSFNHAGNFADRFSVG